MELKTKSLIGDINDMSFVNLGDCKLTQNMKIFNFHFIYFAMKAVWHSIDGLLDPNQTLYVAVIDLEQLISPCLSFPSVKRGSECLRVLNKRIRPNILEKGLETWWETKLLATAIGEKALP